jgi:hypothetical protein
MRTVTGKRLQMARRSRAALREAGRGRRPLRPQQRQHPDLTVLRLRGQQLELKKLVTSLNLNC